jgi:hypothetical protein
MAKGEFVIMDDETLRRIAHIVGPQSAAARALDEAERQREMGIDAVVGSAGAMLLVCSRQFAELRASAPPNASPAAPPRSE